MRQRRPSGTRDPKACTACGHNLPPVPAHFRVIYAAARAATLGHRGALASCAEAAAAPLRLPRARAHSFARASLPSRGLTLRAICSPPAPAQQPAPGAEVRKQPARLWSALAIWASDEGHLAGSGSPAPADATPPRHARSLITVSWMQHTGARARGGHQAPARHSRLQRDTQATRP